MPPLLSDREIPESVKENISGIIYELMNIGVIIQNGNNDYYNTSYFHIKTFLEAIEGPYKEFLTHILNNKFFGRICGSHSGFGYNFENILINAIMMRANEETPMDFDGIPKIIELGRITDVSALNLSKINWNSAPVDFNENVLYHSPKANAIDLLLKQNNTLFLVQITSAATNLRSKHENWKKSIKSIAEKQKVPICGWFFSFFPLELTGEEAEEEKHGTGEAHPSFYLTSSSSLKQLLGAEIFEKLKEIKTSLL